MRSVLPFLLLAALAHATSAAAPPAFSKRPQASKAGQRVKLDFAADRETDVAVYVENARGEVVRHLVAGVLGRNPPPPLQAAALEQSVEWDGRDDDGRLAGGGPFQFRVGLGLTPSYAGQAFAAEQQTGPNRFERVLGMNAGPDGRLYVLDFCGGWVWSTTKVLVFRRDGSYEQTIKPFPANIPVEKVRASGAFINSFGGLNLMMHHPQGLAFYPSEDIAHQPAITSDGHLVLAVVPSSLWGGVPQLAVLDRDGGIPSPSYAGPGLGNTLRWTTYPVLAAAPDGTAIYLTGLGVQSKEKPAHAVYYVARPDCGPAEVWFGDPAKPGNDPAHLSDPRGLAFDGKGHLLVADHGNNRVLVLDEKDKSVAGSFPVPAPDWLAVHPKTGAIYVASGPSMLLKFSGYDHPREVARGEFAALIERTPAGPYRSRVSLRFALDASREPAVLWVASASPVRQANALLRCEDQGRTFSDPAEAGCFVAKQFWRPAADPTRREVLCKIEDGGCRLSILHEKSGEIRNIGGGVAGSEGRNHRLGPDGAIYAQDHAFGAGGVIRYDRQGKPKPFAATADDPHLRGRLPVGFTGTTCWERDFSVDRKGDIYVKARGPEYHGLMTVHVYDQQGRRKRIVLQTVSDGMYGPRLDPQGNLYVMEAVKPSGQPCPNEFLDLLQGKANAERADWYDWLYGSIVKFGPAGGAIWFSGNRAPPLTYEDWGADLSIAGLKTTGGNLTGTIAKPPAVLNFPDIRLDAAQYAQVTLRLKNQSAGDRATLNYHHLRESYVESCGPGFTKTVAIRPESDFSEYTFDMSDQPQWKGPLWHLSLVPSNAGSGSFSIDWVRIGPPGSKLVWNFDAEDGPDKKLPATMRQEAVGACRRPGGATLQGALWWKPGFSPLGDMTVGRGGCDCHCTGSDFDVDDFGRVFAPDTARFRVGVLDTNGNEILSFGGYGNQDCCGPDSYVLDPATKLLRPRKPGDPADLASPFAKPEIAFAWIVGLAVTDNYAYVADVINKRILRVKLAYAAAETVAVP
jgi:hypothetical protein